MVTTVRYLGVVACIFILMLATTGTATAKSLYVISHHDGTFQAYNIDKDDGTLLMQAQTSVGDWGPAGLAVHADTATLFVTYEFQSYVWVLDAQTMEELDKVSTPGAYDLAGIDVDDLNDIVFAADRFTDQLYAYDWDRDALTLALRVGYPKTLGTCEGALGLAYDELSATLYVACSVWGSGTVRGYQEDLAGNWLEVMSYVPAIPPVGIAVDRVRGYVYTTAPAGSCAYAPSGYTKLSMYDLNTQQETVFELGHGGMGIAVDEKYGYVYLTGGCDGDDIGCWNTWNPADPIHPLGLFESTGSIGSPAGIATGNISYNPLNLTKTDGLDEDGCAVVGSLLTYEICFGNPSALDVDTVVVEDLLPGGVTFVSASDGGIEDDGTCRWEFAVVTAGEEKCVTLTVRVNSDVEPGGSIENAVDIVATQLPVPSTAERETEVCPVIPVHADIKPGVCPNRFDVFDSVRGVKAQGGLTAAFLGTEDFDVTLIDPSTVRLMLELDGPWVEPRDWFLKDVGTPYEDELCGCHAVWGDGYYDLFVRFRAQEIVRTLGLTEPATIPLMLVGNLYGEDGELGPTVVGQDCVWVQVN